ncbi:Ergothioneine biosynthesis protein 1 [Fulvia fulva]|uniref:4-dimethylallyltryptophan N-methyltransferase n=1 Tax=Passalora fulva TaxID=5499 RepID=A0A9Q8LHW9_PASFU|nr:Ergothioneine biosynthesis protein 1 [Fulvia fulva]KAK4624764.1 Ergothioneine biosynthesis protein 1 [Fulvia fulva]KAK4624780.1 Ergothioneine biosynthesis protein 1 [Fulvia fulva]UJO17795.1 Ergothioneine biosynthesis protein 1 [Fulvia fulva]WPV14952.1 Ergothioneine biosynthesis protein 1 [Fulvia fulva]WPV29544.1 Ergothioneine biosynthesis protein 1 [Fulvia fulva]
MQYIGKHPFPIASWPLARSKSGKYSTDIKDIRPGGQRFDPAKPLRDGLRKPDGNGQRSFDKLFLRGQQGNKDFDQNIDSPDSHLQDAEIELLPSHSAELAETLPAGTTLLEPGSRSLRRTNLILQAIDSQHKIVDYYALDLDQNELEQFLRELDPGRFKYIRCHGLIGTHDDARAWITKYENKQRPISVLSLGSAIGSMVRSEASKFWLEWSGALRKNGDQRDCHIIIAIDSCKGGGKVSKAFRDEEGRSARFTANVLDRANRQLGKQIFQHEDWTQQGEWEAESGRHSQYLVPQRDIDFEGTTLVKGERILVSHSHRYDDAEKQRLWEDVQLKEVRRYMNANESYGLHVLSLRSS